MSLNRSDRRFRVLHGLHLKIFRLILFYQIFIPTFVLSEEHDGHKLNIKNVVGGDCVISGHTLYYLAGRLVKPEVTNRTLSQKIRRRENFDAQLEVDLGDSNHIFARRLDLGSRFDLDDADGAPWEDLKTNLNITFEQLSPMFPQIVATDDKRGDIFILGGAGAKLDHELVNFDPNHNNFFVDQESSYIVPPHAEWVENMSNMSAPAHGNFVQSDLDRNQFLLFGGVSLRNGKGNCESLSNIAALGKNTTFSDARVFRYRAEEKTWAVDSLEDGELSFLHSATVNNGKMYVVGGIHPYSLKPYSWSSIRVYDIKHHQWSILPVRGPYPQPRYGHRAVMIDDHKLAIVGGAGGSQSAHGRRTLTFDSRILLLNLKDFTWNSVAPEGLKGSYMGCAAIYNKKLIYAFGQTDDSPSVGRTYVIDTETWQETKSYLPPSGIFFTGERNYSYFRVGAIVGGSLVMLFLVTLLAYCYRTKLGPRFAQVGLDSEPPKKEVSEKNSSATPPQSLTQPLWSSYNDTPDVTSSLMNLTARSNNSSAVDSLNQGTLQAHLSSLDTGDMTVPEISNDSASGHYTTIYSRNSTMNRGHNDLSLLGINTFPSREKGKSPPIVPNDFPPNTRFADTSGSASPTDHSSDMPTVRPSRNVLDPNSFSQKQNSPLPDFTSPNIQSDPYFSDVRPGSSTQGFPIPPPGSPEALTPTQATIDTQALNRATSTPEQATQLSSADLNKTRRLTISEVDRIVRDSEMRLLKSSSINVGMVVGHKVDIQPEPRFSMPIPESSLSKLAGLESPTASEPILYHYSNIDKSTADSTKGILTSSKLISPSDIDFPLRQNSDPELKQRREPSEISSLGSSADTIELSPIIN